MTFKDHFSGHATLYRQARPVYPDALFAWLAGQCARRDLAWDAGAGNGQASVALAAHFARVLATDPSASQIASADPHPRIDFRVEPAEQCSAADASVDLVAVAQALHWFEHARFYAEARRVLRPGGVIAAWSYGLMRIAPAIDELVYELYEPILGPYWPPERRHVESGYRELAFPFAESAAPAFEIRHDWTLAEVIAYLETWSALQRCRKATGLDPLADLRDRLQVAWQAPPDQRRPVVWPMLMRVGRATTG